MFGVMHVVHVSARADESIGQDSTNKSNHGNVHGGCDVCLKVLIKTMYGLHVYIINVFHVILLPVFGAFLMNIKFGVILHKD